MRVCSREKEWEREQERINIQAIYREIDKDPDLTLCEGFWALKLVEAKEGNVSGKVKLYIDKKVRKKILDNSHEKNEKILTYIFCRGIRPPDARLAPRKVQL